MQRLGMGKKVPLDLLEAARLQHRLSPAQIKLNRAAEVLASRWPWVFTRDNQAKQAQRFFTRLLDSPRRAMSPDAVPPSLGLQHVMHAALFPLLPGAETGDARIPNNFSGFDLIDDRLCNRGTHLGMALSFSYAFRRGPLSRGKVATFAPDWCAQSTSVATR